MCKSILGISKKTLSNFHQASKTRIPQRPGRRTTHTKEAKCKTSHSEETIDTEKRIKQLSAFST